jgi:hypothetical protein
MLVAASTRHRPRLTRAERSRTAADPEPCLAHGPCVNASHIANMGPHMGMLLLRRPGQSVARRGGAGVALSRRGRGARRHERRGHTRAHAQGAGRGAAVRQVSSCAAGQLPGGNDGQLQGCPAARSRPPQAAQQAHAASMAMLSSARPTPAGFMGRFCSGRTCLLYAVLPCSGRRLIYTLREYPNTEDFVYLRRLDRNPSEYDPYALEVRTSGPAVRGTERSSPHAGRVPCGWLAASWPPSRPCGGREC